MKIVTDIDHCKDCKNNSECADRESQDFPRDYSRQPYCTGHSKHDKTDFSKQD